MESLNNNKFVYNSSIIMYFKIKEIEVSSLEPEYTQLLLVRIKMNIFTYLRKNDYYKK